ncbi:hypothetical protein H8A97_30520 [Bradyrhizobium sp. Arg62]|uniref:hypothetical protein n=1 Tax=Bradyrhizobium brasilense TaxID=1419277 RepID=UPI001E5F5AF7|nr:hypothetical protein [Bradyrhizobium brasilense]MCC8949321.1 hypothetical protein [Bradyrhizobium brasilense]
MNERLRDAVIDRNFVGVYSGGTAVYVIMKRRDEFDLLAIPAEDHGENENGHILSKSIDADGVSIIFQFVLKERTPEALRDDLKKIRLEREGRASA